MSNGEVKITSNGKVYTDLQRAIGELSLNILDGAGAALDEAKEGAALWAAQELRKASVAHGWKNYYKGWTYTAEGKRSKRYIVHNSSHYQLTHLLEKGHRIVTKSGRDTGKRAPAYPHIAPINDQVPDKVEELFLQKLKEQGLT